MRVLKHKGCGGTLILQQVVVELHRTPIQANLAYGPAYDYTQVTQVTSLPGQLPSQVPTIICDKCQMAPSGYRYNSQTRKVECETP